MSDSPSRPDPAATPGEPAHATDPGGPATAAQYGIWLTDRLTHVPEVFHLALRFAFDRIDTDALGRAVAATVARHPALGSALVERDGGLRRVPAGRTPALDVVDTAADTGEALAKRLAEEVALPFDLATGPLARFTLHQRPGGAAELLVVAHHAVFDGNSKDVLAADLAAAYAAALGGGPALSAGGEAFGAPAADPELVARAAGFHGPRWAAATDPVLPGGARAGTDAGPGEAVSWRLDGPGHAALVDAARAGG
ncbi:condensation domain-containing protein, partial [Kitasatospora sp. NPDC093806]|uniref:condensation domain-containing protein n=1 Tax=Kitasatospora sp. NPDC093806 TaxID=3155075 RepID=UPI00342652F0